MFKCLGLSYKKKAEVGRGGGQKSRRGLDKAQAAQAQYQGFINNTCGLILRKH